MTPEVVEKARDLAMRWMPGTRFGSARPSWKHPEDVVAVLRRLPGVRPELETQYLLEAMGWAHDLLEDGVTETGAKVTEETLRTEGLPEEVVVGVRLLSKEKWMTPAWYQRQVMGAPDLARIVKCADRIANLTEARTTFPPRRWENYVKETKAWILPMAHELGNPFGAWLALRLGELVNAEQP